MTETPEPVRIDDLLDPVFPDGVGDALDAMESETAALDWSPASIRSDASTATGLDDFGDDLIDDGLELLAVQAITFLQEWAFGELWALKVG